MAGNSTRHRRHDDYHSDRAGTCGLLGAADRGCDRRREQIGGVSSGWQRVDLFRRQTSGFDERAGGGPAAAGANSVPAGYSFRHQRQHPPPTRCPAPILRFFPARSAARFWVSGMSSVAAEGGLEHHCRTVRRHLLPGRGRRERLDLQQRWRDDWWRRRCEPAVGGRWRRHHAKLHHLQWHR